MIEHPDSFRAHFLLGVVALKRGTPYYPEAADEFRKAAALNPEYSPARMNLGGTCVQLGRFRKPGSHTRKRSGLAATKRRGSIWNF